MIRKSNSIIVLLLIKNNSLFKNKLKTCIPPSMSSSSLISCLSASLGHKGLFSSVNIADVVRRVVLLFLLCFWPIVHLFLHRETSEMLCHFLLTLYAKSKNIWNYYLSVCKPFQGDLWWKQMKKKPSLPACYPSYSRWGQTHPYLNHSTQKTNYQVFLPQKIPESKISNPPKYPSIICVTWRLCEWLAW